MKKPRLSTISTSNENLHAILVNGVSVNHEPYSEMIDALIEANDYIIENAPDEIYPEQLLNKLEITLKKAGVEI